MDGQSQEGSNLGKRVAREKSMRATGEMVAGSKPEYGDGRETGSRGAVVAIKKLKEREGQDLSSCSENDDELRSMFDEWAEKYEKVYSSEKEREERFAIFLSTKKEVDKRNSLGRPYNTVGLNQFADMRFCEIRFGHGIPGKALPLPFQPEYDFDPEITGMSCEELKEARIKFEKWAVKHEKVYVSEKDREKRFMIFLDNKRKSDEFFKEHSELWTHDGYGGYMDLMWWEVPIGPQHESERECCCSKLRCSSCA